MEMIVDFLNRHKVFLTIVIVGLSAYYIILYIVYLRKEKENISNNDNIFNKNVSNIKNINILAEELDDVPIVDDQIKSVDNTIEGKEDWKSLLQKINLESDRLEHNEKLDDFLNDSGIDIGE